MVCIFDLDGTLADCEHRRHFVDKNKTWCKECHKLMSMEPTIDIQCLKCGNWPTKWKPNWKAFYESCDKDTPITPVLDTFIHLTQGEPFNHDVQIWSGRCESVREKTLKWLVNLTGYCEDYQYWDRRLKMRPVGDSTPDDELKERWLDEYIQSMWPKIEKEAPDRTKYARKDPIHFVFDGTEKCCNMWLRRGIFVFNCCQHDEEF